MDETPLQYLLRLHQDREGLSKQEAVHTKLGNYGLPSHNHLIPIAKLSGGQSTAASNFVRKSIRRNPNQPKPKCKWQTRTMIVASIVVLSLSKLNGDPDYKLFSWVVGYACGCVLMLPLLYCRYIVRGTVNLQLYGIVEVLKMSLSCFFAVWFVLGNVWVFGSSSTGKDDTKLETLCLVFLASGCIMYAMPVFRCAAFCLLLPFLILPTLASPQEQAREANPDYSFNALPTYNFKLKENGTGESGVLAAGTDKERAISGEDAVCCICLGKYADNDEVRELPCSHFFHVECVDKWLKINPRCPLCQSELGGAGGASTLVTHSSQDQSERMTDTAS
ncbi:E3 ubiquitin-protein ligase At4g11680 [Vitis vinifera]|uniref:E3 ubiquitin-protein ligase At4g11680 n=1 Tax=Vitis vinifera TaxID=29760 RepID=UPI002882F64C|nr:E3 ubiquitin-protein ligase At4g11680 [Vitis vinifera]